MMRMFRRNAILMAGLLVAAAGPVAAQATRTWVSGVGDDANPCSRTAPCKTFAGAISKTMADGEINVLDPGGFGSVTITKSLTIDGSGGSIAGVLVSGTNGITVAAGPTDTVVLRNLDIDGLGVAGAVEGVKFLSGKQLIIDGCNIYGFGQRNIDIEPTTPNANVLINNTLVHDGVNNGIVVTPTGPASVVLNHVQSVNNANIGLVVVNGNVQVLDSVISNNTAAGIDLHGAGVADVLSSTVSNNGNGIQSSGNTPIARISGVTLFDNSLSSINFQFGQIFSFGNNQMAGAGGPNFGVLIPIANQ
jgi:hypothetical protein